MIMQRSTDERIWLCNCSRSCHARDSRVGTSFAVLPLPLKAFAALNCALKSDMAEVTSRISRDGMSHAAQATPMKGAVMSWRAALTVQECHDTVCTALRLPS